MRLCRFSASGVTKLGVEIDQNVIDLQQAWGLLGEHQAQPFSAPGNDMRAFLCAGEGAIASAQQVCDSIKDVLARKGRNANPGELEGMLYARSAVRLLAPVPDPLKILLLGLNYRDHADEVGQEVPDVPIVFGKYANSIIGPTDPITLPKAAATSVDYEAELAFVIGKRAKNVPLGDAFSYIAGYMALNDVSARDLQFAQSQWLVGKTPDTFAPTGPCIVTRDEIPDPHILRVRGLVNGRVLQDSNTEHLIFDVPYLLHHLSQTMTLEPGDIISTGTPGGVGFRRQPPVFLRAGDIVRVEVEGIGALENPVRLEE